MYRRRNVVSRTIIASAAIIAAACSGSSPSAPTPSSGSSSGSGPSPCAAFTTAAALTTTIVHGTACSAANSSIVLVNLRDAAGNAVGYCSGTVIAPRAVLTAAHCLGSETTKVGIYPGSGTEVPATSFAANPGYQPSAGTGDVGVVMTSQDLNRTPMPLLLSRDARVGEQAVVGGWGVDENGIGEVLRGGLTSVSVATPDSVQTMIGLTVAGICNGDSGSPLLLSEGGVWAIGGVTSAQSFGGVCGLGSDFFIPVRNAAIMSFILGAVPNAATR